MPDQLDFSAQYNTPLSPLQENAYRNWVGAQTQATGRDVNRDEYDYDMRGWWQANKGAPLTDGHLTDQFKKPNHPTFSDQSQYHGVDGYQGGSWQQRGDGTYSFTPGQTNMHLPNLPDYFKQVEPGNTLNLPQGGQ